MLVSIVVPCYNSEKTIEKLVDLCFETFETIPGYECEMILVNDYSKDGTFEAIKRAAKKHDRVKGINFAKNFGQHSALMAAFHYVEGDYVIGLDDDLQNHPSQIPEFLKKAEEGYDIVFGVYKKRNFSKKKNLINKFSHFLMWHLLDRPKDIEMSNFWLARRYVIEKTKEFVGPNVFIQLIFFSITHNIAEINIEHYEREVGSSNYTFKKGLALFMRLVNYSVIPLRISAGIGVLFALAGFAAGIIVFVRKLVHPDMAVGWPSLMCAMFVLFGIVLLMLGVIGEYIGKMIITQSNSPQFVIRETVGVSRPQKKALPKMTELHRPEERNFFQK